MSGLGGRPKGDGIRKDEGYKEVKPITTTTTNKKKAKENDATDDIRNAIQEMLTGSLPFLPGWLEQIGQENPERAMALFINFAEYVLPKQQRTDNKGENASPVVVNFELSSALNSTKSYTPPPIRTNPTPTNELLGID